MPLLIARCNNNTYPGKAGTAGGRTLTCFWQTGISRACTITAPDKDYPQDHKY